MSHNKYAEDAINGTEKGLRELKIKIAEAMIHATNMSTSSVISGEVLTDYLNDAVDLLSKAMLEISSLSIRVLSLPIHRES